MQSSGITNNEVNLILNIVTGGLSVIGCLWIFHFYFKTITPRPVMLKLILFLSGADFIYSVANLLSPFDQDDPDLCAFEAVIRIFSLIAGLYWATAIAVASHQRFFKGLGFQQDKFFTKALILGFMIPTLYVASAFIPSNYEFGPATFGCYVVAIDSPTQLEKLMTIVIYDGIPVSVALIVNLIIYYLIAKRFNQISKDLPMGTAGNIQRLFWYPAVIFIAYIPSFIDNLLEHFQITSSESYAFTIIHIVFTHSVGLTNAIVYGLQRRRHYEVYEKSKNDLIKNQTNDSVELQDGSDKSSSRSADSERSRIISNVMMVSPLFNKV